MLSSLMKKQYANTILYIFQLHLADATLSSQFLEKLRVHILFYQGQISFSRFIFYCFPPVMAVRIKVLFIELSHQPQDALYHQITSHCLCLYYAPLYFNLWFIIVNLELRTREVKYDIILFLFWIIGVTIDNYY